MINILQRAKTKLQKTMHAQIFFVLVLALAASFLPGSSLAYFDYSQHKTNELHGIKLPANNYLSITKILRNLDGSDLTSDQLKERFEFTVEFSDGGSYRYYIESDPILLSLPKYEPTEFLETEENIIEVEQLSDEEIILENSFEDSSLETETQEPLVEEEIILENSFEDSSSETETQEEFYALYEYIDFTSGSTLYLSTGQTAIFPQIPNNVGYTVVETPVDGYTTTSYGTSGVIGEVGVDGLINTVVFINIFGFTPPKDTVTISGEKIWNHGNNVLSEYPASIAVRLLANGTVVDMASVTAAENWQWSFTLPKYNSSDEEIIYTVEEMPVSGYTSVTSGYNIINTYIEPSPTLTPIPPTPTLSPTPILTSTPTLSPSPTLSLSPTSLPTPTSSPSQTPYISPTSLPTPTLPPSQTPYISPTSLPTPTLQIQPTSPPQTNPTFIPNKPSEPGEKTKPTPIQSTQPSITIAVTTETPPPLITLPEEYPPLDVPNIIITLSPPVEIDNNGYTGGDGDSGGTVGDNANTSNNKPSNNIPKTDDSSEPLFWIALIIFVFDLIIYLWLIPILGFRRKN